MDKETRELIFLALRKIKEKVKSVKSGKDVEITNTPGYWRLKHTCGGKGKCRSAIHNIKGCERGMRHTVFFSEKGKRDKKGQFVNQYRAWSAWNELSKPGKKWSA